MFDGDIYEKLFGKKNKAVSDSDTNTNYVNQAKEDISNLYNNNYISPNNSMNKNSNCMMNGVNGTTNGTMNGMNGTANGTMNGMNGTTNGIMNGVNGTTGGMMNGVNGTTNGINGTTNCTMNSMNNKPLPPFPNETPLAMAYIPFQQWQETYEESKAFSKGTIFPCLDKPFIGKGAIYNGSK